MWPHLIHNLSCANDHFLVSFIHGFLDSERFGRSFGVGWYKRGFGGAGAGAKGGGSSGGTVGFEASLSRLVGANGGRSGVDTG